MGEPDPWTRESSPRFAPWTGHPSPFDFRATFFFPLPFPLFSLSNRKLCFLNTGSYPLSRALSMFDFFQKEEILRCKSFQSAGLASRICWLAYGSRGQPSKSTNLGVLTHTCQIQKIFLFARTILRLGLDLRRKIDWERSGGCLLSFVCPDLLNAA